MVNSVERPDSVWDVIVVGTTFASRIAGFSMLHVALFVSKLCTLLEDSSRKMCAICLNCQSMKSQDAARARGTGWLRTSSRSIVPYCAHALAPATTIVRRRSAQYSSTNMENSVGQIIGLSSQLQ